MSVKAMSLVWDFECPQIVNGIDFRPNHKFVLLAYSDHADHLGKNIWPAVSTIAKKTGYQERNVQYITRELEDMGLLVEDGIGPRGTNRWLIPYDDGGAKIAPVQPSAPVQSLQGAKNEDSLGAIPSGATPRVQPSAPELKEPEPYLNKIPEERFWQSALQQLEMEMPRAAFTAWVRDTSAVAFDGATLTIGARTAYARDWLNSRLASTVSRLMVGIMNQDVSIEFVVTEQPESED